LAPNSPGRTAAPSALLTVELTLQTSWCSLITYCIKKKIENIPIFPQGCFGIPSSSLSQVLEISLNSRFRKKLRGSFLERITTYRKKKSPNRTEDLHV
jgi:hypothetical protein